MPTCYLIIKKSRFRGLGDHKAHRIHQEPLRVRIESIGSLRCQDSMSIGLVQLYIFFRLKV